MDTLLDTLFDHTFISILVTIVVLFIAQSFIKYFMGIVIHRVVSTHKFQSHKAAEQREHTVTGLVNTASAVLLWIIGIFMVLAQLEVNIGAILTGAGLVGVIVGFGAQSTIKNLLSGLFIILENQYRIGDIITVNNVSGVVEDLTIRITRLRDLDGNLHVIQNGDIQIVTNRTFGHSNVNLDVGVSYGSDLDKVIRTVNETGKALAKDAVWKEQIIEPIGFLRIDDFADSAIIVKCLGKVLPGSQWDVAGEFRLRLKRAFDKAGIEIPFPQRVIHQAKK